MRRVVQSFLFAVCGFAVAVAPAHAVATPPAFATIDWTTFSFQLFSFGNPAPTLTWDNQSSNVAINPGDSFYEPDWTTPLQAAGGVAEASVTSAALIAQYTAHPSMANLYADAQRRGTFTLSSQSYVVFSVQASVFTSVGVPTGGAAYSWAYLTAEGPDMFGGPDTQRSSTDKLVFATIPASDVSASGLLIASFSNLTNGDLEGNLSASATVGSYGGTIGPIPEPSGYLMMLAGLALMGGVVSARRRSVANAA